MALIRTLVTPPAQIAGTAVAVTGSVLNGAVTNPTARSALTPAAVATNVALGVTVAVADTAVTVGDSLLNPVLLPVATALGFVPGPAVGAVTENYTDTAADDTFATKSGTLQVSNTNGATTFALDGSVASTADGFDLQKAGIYGTFFLNSATGAYQFVANDTAIEALKANASDAFSVTATSGGRTSQPATVTIAVAGANDTAEIGGNADGSLTEDTTTTASGTLTIADRDAGDAEFVAQTNAAGTYGTFSIDKAGAWTYALDNTKATVQALAAGAIVSDAFTVTSKDGTDTETVTVTITGTNDAATISGTTIGAVTEDDTTNTATGTLSVADVDAGDAEFVVQTNVAGTYGTFSIDSTGAWTYVLDNTKANVQALPANKEVTDTFTVTSKDGSDTETVTVTITGTNDAATISGTTTGAVTEDDTTNTVTGTLSVSDVDEGDAGFQAVAASDLVGRYGDFTFIAATGAWTYVLDNARAATNALAQGVQVTDTLTVKSLDGTEQRLTVTITGTNDGPVLNEIADIVYNDTAADDTFAVATGSAVSIDPDTTVTYGITGGTDQGNATVTKVGTYGTLTLHKVTGDYTYTPVDSALESLKAVESETFVINTFDTRGLLSTRNLVVKVNGVNDTAEITGLVTGNLNEDDLNAVSGSLVVTDRDAGDVGFQPVDPADLVGTYGNFTFDATTGAWTYTLDDTKDDALAKDQVAEETLTIKSADGTERTLVVTLTGTNDAPVAVADAAAVNEDAPLLRGSVADNDSDVDKDAVLTYSTEATVAGFALAADGSYSFNPSNAAYQHLAEGAEETLTIDYTVTDEHGASDTATLTITLTGTNDLPVAVADVATATEDGGLVTGSVADNDSDVDDGAVLTYALTTPVSGLTFADDGAYTFDPANAAYQHLAQGATQDVVVDFTVTDGVGEPVASTLTITVTGTNDTPVVTAAAVYSATGLSFTVSDVDDGAKLSLKSPLPSYFTSATVNDDTSTTLQVVAQSIVRQDEVVVTDEFNATANVGYVALGTDAADGVGTATFTLSASGAAYGFGGNDKIVGTGGADFLFGGQGNDTLLAGAGNDLISGDEGDDTAVLTVASTGFDNDTVRLGLELGDQVTLEGVAAAQEVLVSFVSGAVGNGNSDSTVTGDAANPAVRLQLQSAGNNGAATGLVGGVTRIDDEGVTLSGARFNVIGLDAASGDLVPSQNRGVFDEVVLGSNGNDVINEASSSEDYYFNGGAGADTFTAGSGQDFLVGGAGNDELIGGGDDDKFIGGGGNDTLEGGAGSNDTAIFTGAFADYTISKNPNGSITVTDSRQSPTDGTDTLKTIEFLKFSDVTVSVKPAAPTAIELFADDSGELGDGISNDTTPTAKVTLAAPSAGLVAVGDKVELLAGTNVIGSATLTATDITAGTVNVTVDPALAADGALSITARINDVFGVTSDNSPALTYTLDTVLAAPTIVLSDSALGAGETAIVTITFDEKVSGLTEADFTVENGVLSDLEETAGSNGKVYTATFTPAADVDDATNVITLAAGQVEDVAGNTTIDEATSANYTIDTKAPVVTGPVFSNDTAFTITSSEAGSVQLKDGSVNVGSATSLTANTEASVTVAAQTVVTTATAVVSDAAGNTTDGAGKVILGTTGNDVITATASAELIYGFGGNDTVSFTGNRADYTLTWDGIKLLATDSTGVTDTLTNVRKLSFADGNVLLVNDDAASGSDVFTSIQSAVNEAISGDTLLIASGTYVEDVTIGSGKALTLDGAGRSGADATLIKGQITVSGVLNNVLRLQDVDVDATGKSYGVFVDAGSTAFGGEVQIDNVRIANAKENGFAYILDGNGSTPSKTETIGAVAITNSDFIGNAPTNTGNNGRGDILFFGYNQDVTLENVDIQAGASARTGVQVRGTQQPGDVAGVGPYAAGGTLTFNNVSFHDSAYAAAPIQLLRLASIAADSSASNVTFTNVSGGFNALLNADSVGGTLNFSSGFTGTNAATPTAFEFTLQGLASSDTFTGSATGDNVFNGRGGIDFLNLGGGVDVVTGGLQNYTNSGRTAGITLTGTADADIISGFVSGIDKYDYEGFLGSTSLTGTVTAVSGANASQLLTTNGDAEVFIRTATTLGANAAGHVSVGNALNTLAASTSAASVLSNYAAFEAELLGANGALNSGNTTFNNALAGAVAQNESVLLVFTNGTHSVALRYTNLDGNASVADKVVTGAEVELVGVFNGTAQLGVSDFI